LPGEEKSETEIVHFGEIRMPAGIVSEAPFRVGGRFSLYRVNPQVVISPAWEKLTPELADVVKLRLDFEVLDPDGGASAGITDILPRTELLDANHGASVKTRLGLGANNQWSVVDASGDVEGTIWWQYDPKIHLTTSGAVGNTAFVVFHERKDGTGWAGQLPVELLVLKPNNKTATLALKISCSLQLGEAGAIHLGENIVKLSLFEQ